MQAKLRLLALFLVIFKVCLNEKVSYDGHVLVRITPRTHHHLKLLNQFENNLDVRFDYFFLNILN